jgi:hypothetical protein
MLAVGVAVTVTINFASWRGNVDEADAGAQVQPCACRVSSLSTGERTYVVEELGARRIASGDLLLAGGAGRAGFASIGTCYVCEFIRGILRVHNRAPDIAVVWLCSTSSKLGCSGPAALRPRQYRFEGTYPPSP